MKPVQDKKSTPLQQYHMITEDKEVLPYIGTPVKIPITRKYNIRPGTQQVQHSTSFNNQTTVFPMERTKYNTVHQW